MAETTLYSVPEVNTLAQPVHTVVAEDLVQILPPERTEDGALYTATFGTARLDGRQVAEVLSGPLAAALDVPATLGDTRLGLKAQTYPNSRIVRAAGRLGSAARSRLREMRPDIKGLVTTMESSGSERMVNADVHVYGEELADLWVKDALNRLKPAALKDLCEQAGISVDELLLWRLKGGNRGNRAIREETFRDHDIEPTLLVEALKQQVFARKLLLDPQGVESAFIPRQDLASYKKHEALPYVELLKRLQTIKNQPRASKESFHVMVEPETPVAERWRVGMYDNNALRHAVTPVIQWLVRKHAMHYTTELVFDGASARYEAGANRLVHVSPVLGAALLAGNIDPEGFRAPLETLFGVNRYMPWRGAELPARASGALPALLGSRPVQEAIVASDAFRGIEAVAYQLADPFVAEK